MGYLALALAVIAALSAVLPMPGMFFGMGLGILAIGVGLVGYRRREARASARLCAAGAMTVAIVAVLLSVTRYALTLMAIDRIETLL